MNKLTRWKVEELTATAQGAAKVWENAKASGALGAVTSGGSSIANREFVRIYTELRDGENAPEMLMEEDWRPHWEGALAPFRAGEGFLLVPAWEKPGEEGLTSIFIDPGMSFGSGDHPTTRHCVALLERLYRREGVIDRVLDVGAGTGVLSLACGKLGATRVTALDIDPFCYAATRRNIALNGLENSVEPVLLSLDLLHGKWPLVMANVVINQIKNLAPLLRERLEDGGYLLLSGFEEKMESEVIEAALAEFKIVDKISTEGWSALMAQNV